MTTRRVATETGAPRNAADASGVALFHLALYGGSVERRYRRQKPAVDAMPWGAFGTRARPSDELLAARRGWTEAALEEYASAAQHALLVRGLVRAQAPLDLTAMASGFPVDELSHAELFARVAGALGGGVSLVYDEATLYPPPGGAIDAVLDAAQMALGSCCVFETFAHAQVRELRTRARDPLLRALWARIARDEAMHARFGWVFIDWVLEDAGDERRKQLSRVAEHAVTTLREKVTAAHRDADQTFAHDGPLGPFDRASHAVFVERALRHRVELPLRRRGIL